MTRDQAAVVIVCLFVIAVGVTMTVLVLLDILTVLEAAL